MPLLYRLPTTYVNTGGPIGSFDNPLYSNQASFQEGKVTLGCNVGPGDIAQPKTDVNLSKVSFA